MSESLEISVPLPAESDKELTDGEKLDAILAVMREIHGKVTMVAEHITPIVDGLAANPMIKGLIGRVFK